MHIYYNNRTIKLTIKNKTIETELSNIIIQFSNSNLNQIKI